MKSSTPVRVMVVEDHGLLAQSLRLALTAEGMEVGVPPLDPVEILAMAERQHPQVVLLDLDLGISGGNGELLVEPLAMTGARVLVVSGDTDRVRLAGCLESGAFGLAAKTLPLDDLLELVRQAAAGEAVLPEGERQQLLAEMRTARHARRRQLAPFASLTPREQHVLAAVMRGLSAGEIAIEAFVSEATVRSQIRGVLTKLGVGSQLAAVALANSVGWVPRT